MSNGGGVWRVSRRRALIPGGISTVHLSLSSFFGTMTILKHDSMGFPAGNGLRTPLATSHPADAWPLSSSDVELEWTCERQPAKLWFLQPDLQLRHVSLRGWKWELVWTVRQVVGLACGHVGAFRRMISVRDGADLMTRKLGMYDAQILAC